MLDILSPEVLVVNTGGPLCSNTTSFTHPGVRANKVDIISAEADVVNSDGRPCGNTISFARPGARANKTCAVAEATAAMDRQT